MMTRKETISWLLEALAVLAVAAMLVLCLAATGCDQPDAPCVPWPQIIEPGPEDLPAPRPPEPRPTVKVIEQIKVIEQVKEVEVVKEVPQIVFVPVDAQPILDAATQALFACINLAAKLEAMVPEPPAACVGGVCDVLKLKTPEIVNPVYGRSYRLICYTGPNCPYCDEMMPVWESLKAEGFTVIVADTADPPKWVGNYRPASIPLMALYDGDRFVRQWVGGVKADELRQALLGDVTALENRSLAPVFDSPENAALMRLAQDAADTQARRWQQGHWDWKEHRFQDAKNQSGFPYVVEICAESWKEQEDASPEELWAEFVKCWRHSPGHWRVANMRHDAYGRAMAKGKNGIWYATIIAADRRATTAESLAVQELAKQEREEEPAQPEGRSRKKR